jgi:hypothetical protein
LFPLNFIPFDKTNDNDKLQSPYDGQVLPTEILQFPSMSQSQTEAYGKLFGFKKRYVNARPENQVNIKSCKGCEAMEENQNLSNGNDQRGNFMKRYQGGTSQGDQEGFVIPAIH